MYKASYSTFNTFIFLSEVNAIKKILKGNKLDMTSIDWIAPLRTQIAHCSQLCKTIISFLTFCSNEEHLKYAHLFFNHC